MTSRRPRSLADYSRAARRRKLIIVLPALVLAIATAITLRDQPNLYQSIAKLRFTPVKTDSAPDVAVHFKEFRDYLASRETLAALIGKNIPSVESSESAISLMRERIAVEPDSNRDSQPGAFTVSYRASDPEIARRMTDEMADLLVTLSSKGPSLAISDAGTHRKRVDDIETQLRDLELRNPWLKGVRPDSSFALPSVSSSSRSTQPSSEAIRARQMTIDGLRDQQYKINQQLADIDRRIAAQRQIVELQKKGSTLRDNPTYAVLIAKRTELQGQRDTLMNRQELTDKHPRVLAINDQIAAINRQIEELREQDTALIGQSAEARELGSFESERNRLKIDLEVTGRELLRRAADSLVQSAPPEPSPVRRSEAASKLAEQYLGLKRSYQESINERQSAEADLAHAEVADRAAVRVLEPATLAPRSESQTHLILISIAAAVGLIFGTFFAVFAESRRFKSLQDARDVEYYTRLPLLAAIPRTATVSERRRARWRAAARLAFATTTSLLATLALTRIFIAADIFALIVKK